MKPKKIPSCLTPRLLVVFTWQLEILVTTLLVVVVIICLRLVSDNLKLDKALLSGLPFKTLQLRSPKTAMGLFMVSA